jgi:hypothetical protein
MALDRDNPLRYHRGRAYEDGGALLLLDVDMLEL